jgi:cytochrome P450
MRTATVDARRPEGSCRSHNSAAWLRIRGGRVTAIASDLAGDEPTPLRFEDVNVPVSGPGEHFATLDDLRAEGGMHHGVAGPNENPFWLVSGAEDILECFQNPEVFSNSSISPAEPEPSFLLIPEMLDGRRHTQWRQLLGSFFSPNAVDRLQPRMHEVMDEILDELVSGGRCDFVADVALRFPNTIFMEMMGLPVADAAQFQVWETKILHGTASGMEEIYLTMQEVMGYFEDLIRDRRKQPREDMLSAATTWTIEGKPIPDSDLLSFCLLMFMAGLDTVAMQLSYSMYHLGSNPADRARLNADPTLWPTAIEEFLRYYAFVAPSRKAMSATTVGGCPVAAGEMVHLPLASANRDRAAFVDADKVLIDRAENRHLAFGAGPHRCLGSHLARRELYVGLTTWHRRIPDYWIDPVVPVVEHGGQVGLNNLPLHWATS